MTERIYGKPPPSGGAEAPTAGWGGKRPGSGPKSNAERGLFSHNVKLHFVSEEEYQEFMALFPNPRDRVVYALRGKTNAT